MESDVPIINKVSFVDRFGMKNLVIGVGLLVIVAGGLSYYLLANGAKSPQAAAQEEVKKWTAAVSKLMELPQDEQPIIATVADPSKLQDQPFFRNAKKGDKVLIYNVAKRAILYDPETNKIVDVAPLSTNQASPTPIKK